MEELKRFNELKAAYYSNFFKKIIDRFVFKNAIIILSVIVSVVFILNFYMRNDFLGYASKIIFFAVLINAIQHIVLSSINKKMLPGSYTSLFLIIPYSIISIFTKNINIDFFSHGFFILILTSALAMIFATFLSLSVGLVLKTLFCHPTQMDK